MTIGRNRKSGSRQSGGRDGRAGFSYSNIGQISTIKIAFLDDPNDHDPPIWAKTLCLYLHQCPGKIRKATTSRKLNRHPRFRKLRNLVLMS